MSIHNILEKLKMLWHVTDRNKTYHPEENVLVHSLQAMHEMKKVSRDPILILAAALHDIGKSDEREKSLRHAHIGAKYLKECGVTNGSVLFLIEQHMRFHLFINGEMKKPSKVIDILEGGYLQDQILLHRCDVMAKEVNHKVFTNKEYRDKLILEVGWYLETMG